MIASTIRHVRQNHALEHATVAMLLEGGIRPPLGGYSTPGGFFIFGRAPTDVVTQAATEALLRLTEGQRSLAVSASLRHEPGHGRLAGPDCFRP